MNFEFAFFSFVSARAAYMLAWRNVPYYKGLIKFHSELLAISTSMASASASEDSLSPKFDDTADVGPVLAYGDFASVAQ